MTPQSKCLIPSLPHEIAVVCLAKIPLLHRHRMSRVCRGWRDLFRDEHFWAMRREQSACETLLLIYSASQCMQGVWHGFHPATKKWIRLPLMPMDGREMGWSKFAVVDGKLFVIGGQVRSADGGVTARSSMVSYFDLKRWEWKEAAPLNVARQWVKTGVLNGLLYVFGGLTNQRQTSTVEVYNPVTKTWKFVSSMPAPIILVSSIVVDGKFYAVYPGPKTSGWDGKGVVYDPQEDEWTEMSEELNYGWSNLPVEFNGQICISRESKECRKGCVWGYDLKSRTWKLVHRHQSIENKIFLSRWPLCFWRDVVQLMNLDGSLRYITRESKGKGGVKIEILDLSRRLVASKYFRPCILAGTADSQLVRLSDDNMDQSFVEFQTVRL